MKSTNPFLAILKKLDWATISGATLALVVCLATIIFEGTHLGSFWNLAAFILIFFGVISTTISGYSFKEIKEIPGVTAQLFISADKADRDPENLIGTMVSLSEKARREGLLKLEDDLKNVKDAFLRAALQLVIDGTDMELLQKMLRQKIESLKERHKIGEMMFTNMGGYSPTMGIIGTVMGLIHVLGEMKGSQEDFARVGPGIAVAFLATFYGIAFANLILLPWANKLKQKSEEEVMVKEMILEGILSIQSGDNPRLLREKLSAFLPTMAKEEKKKKPLFKGAPKGKPVKAGKPAPAKG
ncbi:MAG: motility protein A [Armatimonadetes bacterium]|nr:motility protein A [Armatimonadota bacterium]